MFVTCYVIICGAPYPWEVILTYAVHKIWYKKLLKLKGVWHMSHWKQSRSSQQLQCFPQKCEMKKCSQPGRACWSYSITWCVHKQVCSFRRSSCFELYLPGTDCSWLGFFIRGYQAVRIWHLETALTSVAKGHPDEISVSVSFNKVTWPDVCHVPCECPSYLANSYSSV